MCEGRTELHVLRDYLCLYKKKSVVCPVLVATKALTIALDTCAWALISIREYSEDYKKCEGN